MNRTCTIKGKKETEEYNKRQPVYIVYVVIGCHPTIHVNAHNVKLAFQKIMARKTSLFTRKKVIGMLTLITDGNFKILSDYLR